jgi:hypothetical protein
MREEELHGLVVMQFFPERCNAVANMSFWKPNEKFSIYKLVIIKLASVIWTKSSLSYVHYNYSVIIQLTLPYECENLYSFK